MFPDQVEDAKKIRCEELGVKGRQQLTVWHEVARELYQAATPEEMDAVKKEMNETSSDSEESSSTPQTYMRFVPV